MFKTLIVGHKSSWRTSECQEEEREERNWKCQEDGQNVQMPSLLQVVCLIGNAIVHPLQSC